jgi:hypothetical protein
VRQFNVPKILVDFIRRQGGQSVGVKHHDFERENSDTKSEQLLKYVKEEIAEDFSIIRLGFRIWLLNSAVPHWP